MQKIKSLIFSEKMVLNYTLRTNNIKNTHLLLDCKRKKKTRNYAFRSFRNLHLNGIHYIFVEFSHLSFKHMYFFLALIINTLNMSKITQ